MTLLNTSDTYKQLQPFHSIEELNANTRLVREQFGKKLTKTALNVLDVLAKWSCKYFGVSYRAKSKIAIELGVTRRTIIRCCNQLESLGIIKQVELKRHNGDRRQSTNAIVFIKLTPVQVVEKKDVTPICHSEDALKKTKIINNTLDTGNADLIKQGLANKLPKNIAKLLTPFFNADDIYAIYGTMIRAKASVNKKIMFEDNENEYRDAILSVINAHKRGKINNLFAVIYRAIQRVTKSINAPKFSFENDVVSPLDVPFERESCTMDGFINAMWG